jgi:hypothetical protein
MSTAPIDVGAAVMVDDPASFVRGRGSLHDVTVLSVGYHLEERRIEIEVEDLNWGVEGDEGYKPRPCILVFAGVSAVSIAAGQDKFHTSVAVSELAWLSHAAAITKGDVTRVDMIFKTSEHWFIECQSLAILDRPTP